jgi:hypothetical protein
MFAMFVVRAGNLIELSVCLHCFHQNSYYNTSFKNLYYVTNSFKEANTQTV